VRIRTTAAIALLPLGLALAGCSEDRVRPQALDTATWAVTAATPLGPPVDCVERDRIRGYAVRSDSVLDFTLDDGSLMRNRLPYACSGLREANRFTYRTALPRVCSTDAITIVLPRGAAGGNCGLGVFQQIAIPARPGALPGRR
jgi:hypothetical protein